MTSRMGPKGQVVIPKRMRDALRLKPGDPVSFELEKSGVRVEPLRDAAPLRGRFRGERLTGALEREHRRELER